MQANSAPPHVQRHTQLRAIVLGVEHPRALAVIRSLGRLGVRIVAVDHQPDARGFYSRFVDQAFVIGPEREDAYRLLRSLGSHGGGLVIATNDHYLGLTAEAHDELSQWFTLTTPPRDVLQRLTSKAECYTLAREVDVHTPNPCRRRPWGQKCSIWPDASVSSDFRVGLGYGDLRPLCRTGAGTPSRSTSRSGARSLNS